jgi:diguanylate cyclase (GGDEF)-like protein
VAAKRKILVVEDSPTELDAVAEVLVRAGYQVVTASTGAEALVQARRAGPDLVLLDMNLPGLSGIDVLRFIKKPAGNPGEGAAQDHFLPVIMMSARADVEAKVQCLNIGADEFLAKPLEEPEIVARCHAMLRIKDLQDQVREAKLQLEKLSIEDGLTKLHNHRHFQEQLRREFGRAQRYRDPLSLVMIDLDHFKAVNDRRGHPFGDMVLRETAQIIRGNLRDTDLCARYGGEEFAVLLPKTLAPGAHTVADRIRLALSAKVFREESTPAVPDNRSAGSAGSAASAVPDNRQRAHAPDSKGRTAAAHSPEAPGDRVTASFGIASYPAKDITSPELLLRCADEELYRSKKAGRNTIRIHGLG